VWVAVVQSLAIPLASARHHAGRDQLLRARDRRPRGCAATPVRGKPPTPRSDSTAKQGRRRTGVGSFWWGQFSTVVTNRGVGHKCPFGPCGPTSGSEIGQCGAIRAGSFHKTMWSYFPSSGAAKHTVGRRSSSHQAAAGAVRRHCHSRPEVWPHRFVESTGPRKRRRVIRRTPHRPISDSDVGPHGPK